MAKHAKKTSSDAPPKPNTPSARSWGVAGVLVLALVAAGLGINNWMRFKQLPDWQHDINALQNAIAALKKDDALTPRISALEAQIAKFETTLRELQERPAANSTDHIPDIAIAVRSGAPFAEILHEAVAVDARWQVLEQWAQHPPPALDQLWQQMQARLPESPPTEPPTEPPGWLAPLTKIIQLRPLNPAQNAVDALTDAIARRDSDSALQAIRTLSGNSQDMLAWQQAYAARIALNQALDRLIRRTEQ